MTTQAERGGHVAEVHDSSYHRDDSYATSCMICDGGLFVCTRCGLLEGSVTTECSGIPSYSVYGDSVYKGHVDYRSGEWVNEVSHFSPVFYSKTLYPCECVRWECKCDSLVIDNGGTCILCQADRHKDDIDMVGSTDFCVPRCSGIRIIYLPGNTARSSFDMLSGHLLMPQCEVKCPLERNVVCHTCEHGHHTHVVWED